MFYILSDTEVALNELLIACRKSADHYEDAATQIDDEYKAIFFRKIAARRNQFCEKLMDAIRELGDLPSEPDPDKETGEIIFEHVGASLSADEAEFIISHRIKAEEQLNSLVKDTLQSDANDLIDSHRRLLDDLMKDTDKAITELSSYV